MTTACTPARQNVGFIRMPEEALRELPELRTPTGKGFELPDGMVKLIYMLGPPVHYVDRGLHDIDTTIHVAADGTIRADRLPFIFEAHRQGIGFDYRSRNKGKVSCRLAALDDRPLKPGDYRPIVAGNTVRFENVAPDLDIVFEVLRGRIRTHRILKSPSAPHSFDWEVTGDTDGLAKVSRKMRGEDAGGHPLILSPIDVQGSIYRERFGGLAKVRDKATRIAKPQPAVYPVSIDPDVTDHITHNEDDGYEAPNSTLRYYGCQLGRLAYGAFHSNAYFRFQGVAIANAASIGLAQLKVNVTGHGSVGYGGGTIYGVASDSSNRFATAGYRPSQVPKTAASSLFTRPTGIGIAAYTVTTQVQEIVNRAGWSSGNNMSFPVMDYETVAYNTTSIEDYAAAAGNSAVLEITLAAAGAKPWWTYAAQQVIGSPL